MLEIVWTFSALSDLEHVRRYIKDFSPGAAAAVAARIIEVADSLATFPHRGRAVRGTRLREITIIPPYIIRYRAETGRVVILRVRHGARRQ